MKPARPVAALLTDFGTADTFVGVMKGVILRFAPRTCIVDLSHEIPPQDVRTAAFQLMVSTPYCPDGTLFVAVVDPGVGSSRKVLYAETSRHRFLGPDNGILSWVFKMDPPRRIRSVENRKLFLSPVSRTFQGRDIFAPVAGRLLAGERSASLGPIWNRWNKLPFPEPVRIGSSLRSQVIAVDRFGNLISGIRLRDVPSLAVHRQDFRARVGRSPWFGLKASYFEGSDRTPFVVIGSFGFLEVALRNGNAARVLKVKVGDEFWVR